MRLISTLLTLGALCGTAAAVDLGGVLPNNTVTDRILPGVGDVRRDTTDTLRDRSRLARDVLNGVRDMVGRPVEEDQDLARLIDRYPDGSRAVHGEILAMAPTAASEAIWEVLGLEIARRETLDPLGIELVVLVARNGETGRAAITRLRAADPSGSYDLNHIYGPSSAAVVAGAALTPAATDCDDCRIGVIDSGADLDHSDLRRAHIETRAFAGREPLPSIHGTAVVSLLVGRGGAAKGASVFLADVYGGRANGGSAEAIAQALAWLATERTPVVTISLAGPPNGLLESAVAAMVARGHIIVAAVGNGGPAAPAAYPAAYLGVIGATAIDAAGQPAVDAQRGPQVAFAAYGVDLQVAALGGGETALSGTSFAAPRIAARAAALMSDVDPANASVALKALRASTVDLGAAGRDDVFGYGALERLSLTAETSP